jgi:hypothetical protein
MEVFSFILLTYYPADSRENPLKSRALPRSRIGGRPTYPTPAKVQRSLLGSPRLRRGLRFVRMTEPTETMYPVGS